MTSLRLLLLSLALAVIGSTLVAQDQTPLPRKKVLFPPELGEVDFSVWSEPQFGDIAESDLFYFFSFRDRTTESGITFRNVVVDDGGKYYKAVHYDHGNGIAVADIDGDGLYDIYFTNQLGDNEMWRNLGGGKFENSACRLPGLPPRCA